MEPPKPEDALEFLNNYDKDKQKQKWHMPSMTNGELPKSLLAIGGTVVVVSIILAMMFGGNGPKNQLIKIVAQQEDMIRADSLALRTARDSNVSATAANMGDFLATDRKQLRGYIIGTLKDKAIDKEATKLHNKSAEDKLTTAYSNNRLDDQFVNIMSSKLSAYKIELTEARTKTKDAKLRAILDQALKNVNDLKLDTLSN